MADKDLAEILGDLRADDLRLDDDGRVVITAPSVIEKLKRAGLKPDLTTARNDTNIICCGNTKCGKASDLGSIVERFAGGAGAV